MKKLIELGNIYSNKPNFKSGRSGYAAGRVYDADGLATAVTALGGGMGAKTVLYAVKQVETRTDSNDGSQPFQQDRVYDPDGISPALQSGLPQGSRKIIQKSQDFREDGSLREFTEYSPTLRANMGDNHPMVVSTVVASRGRGEGWKQTLEERKDGVTNTLTGVEKNNMIKEGIRIRRLTPVECERLQGYQDGWTATGVNEKGAEVSVSDSQRYKCCGNSVTTFVVASVMEKLYGGK